MNDGGEGASKSADSTTLFMALAVSVHCKQSRHWMHVALSSFFCPCLRWFSESKVIQNSTLPDCGLSTSTAQHHACWWQLLHRPAQSSPQSAVHTVSTGKSAVRNPCKSTFISSSMVKCIPMHFFTYFEDVLCLESMHLQEIYKKEEIALFLMHHNRHVYSCMSKSALLCTESIAFCFCIIAELALTCDGLCIHVVTLTVSWPGKRHHSPHTISL